jgi:hypothetical protein
MDKREIYNNNSFYLSMPVDPFPNGNIFNDDDMELFHEYLENLKYWVNSCYNWFQRKGIYVEPPPDPKEYAEYPEDYIYILEERAKEYKKKLPPTLENSLYNSSKKLYNKVNLERKMKGRPRGMSYSARKSKKMRKSKKTRKSK